ncbi:MAG: sulfoxide reductase heme-binding subunit YedZ [Rhizobiaceae bacterium]|nr:sulfoxide reductase heme-binding subunit YedZ [Rhizobiaceae bacterium]
MIAAGKFPWNDRGGAFSPLKALCLAAILAPAAILAWRATIGSLGTGATGPLGPRPVTEAIHFTGDWAIRFLLASLAVTTLRRIASLPKLIIVRRQIGLAALFYAAAHLVLYALDQKWDLAKVASEIVLRYYLTIGFVALMGLLALGVTSTDAMIRKLGKRWNQLHKLVYVLAALAVLHYFMQSKADVFQPTLMAGFFAYMMLWRVAQSRGANGGSVLTLTLLALVAGLLTAALEYGWYGLATNIPPGRVLAANLNFAHSIRPAWWVLFTGLALVPIAYVRQGQGGSRNRRPRARAGEAAA